LHNKLGRLRRLSCDAELAEHRKAGGASAPRAPLPPTIIRSSLITLLQRLHLVSNLLVVLFEQTRANRGGIDFV
jgi:hypothetical protein